MPKFIVEIRSIEIKRYEVEAEDALKASTIVMIDDILKSVAPIQSGVLLKEVMSIKITDDDTEMIQTASEPTHLM